MAVVHHSNYLRYFELARVVWLEENDQPYTEYLQSAIHLAVTRVELDCHRGARFDDRLLITTWLEWIRGASLRMAYCITRGDELIATGASEHASVNDEGRVRRIPRERRAALSLLAPNTPSSST